MAEQHPNNPMHGITLEKIVNVLVDHWGWKDLAIIIPINCFKSNPSVRSSLRFLRRTPWARKKVETLYLDTIDKMKDTIKDPIKDAVIDSE